MKKYTFITLLLFGFNLLMAQFGIGTSTPNTSSVLDIDVSTITPKRGFLLPRLQLLNNRDKVTVENPATGLLVYNLLDSGIGTNKVFANMYYFWNGTKWASLSDIEEVKRELLPQVFFIAESANGITTPQNTNTTTGNNINIAPIVLKFSSSSIMLNTGNNIDLVNDNSFKINNAGLYEISGFINYNPSIPINSNTNLELKLEVSTDNGSTWTQKLKTYGVWGYGTGLNNRSNNIAPTVIDLPANSLIRCTVFKSNGENHSTSAVISAPTGLTYGKVIKIQKIG
ncbi:hypothetical protein [Empedobacter brevis]|uniref:hypothetical protein n=1 Tax=Empedobacter brevis TaxID=247 RepID=UPI0028D398D6|nr:hypothetical protein [Empedobacter brevis]